MKHPNKEIMENLIKYTERYAVKYGHATGAFVVKGNEILAKAVTTVEKDKNPTSHAELKAIGKACKRIKNYHLNGCYLYTTQEPCPMCASAIVWARIAGVVYGWESHNLRDHLKISCQRILETSSEKIEVFPKFMEKECIELKNKSINGEG